MLRLFGGGGALLLGSGFFFSHSPPPTVFVNPENDLLSRWPSEVSGSDLAPECAFYNFSVMYDSSLCSHFTIARSAAVPAQAMRRALRCAGAFGAECLLSPEVGLAIPATFLFDHSSQRMRMLIAPKPLDSDSNATEFKHVRIAAPDANGVLGTRTEQFNTSIQVEYLDGDTRALRRETLADDEAFCVQLLRLAFEPTCWTKLD